MRDIFDFGEGVSQSLAERCTRDLARLYIQTVGSLWKSFVVRVPLCFAVGLCQYGFRLILRKSRF